MNVFTFVAHFEKMIKSYCPFLFFFILIIWSCNKESRWDCIKRTGTISNDLRILPPFAKIYLNDNVNIFIKQGIQQEVKIEAGKNLISLIKTEVVNNELFIKNNNRCNWARSYKNGDINVYITMPVLRCITHYGSGNIKSLDTIVCDTLEMLTRESGDIDLTINANIVFSRLHGTSDITLRGKSHLQGIFHMGEGFLHFEDLETQDTWSHSKASGNQYLNAKNNLSVRLDWVGNIYYVGNPTITISDIGKGTGKVIQQN